MDFSLSDEQKSIRDLARQILGDRATNERLRELEQGKENFDRELWAELAKANLLGVAVPEEHGGMGMGFAELAVLIEEVGRSAAPVPALATLAFGAWPIAHFGSDEQKRRWLPAIAGGTSVVTAGLHEPGVEDLRTPYTTAKAESGGFVLDGTKICVPFVAQSERILVVAKADGGPGLFLVDPAAEGVTIEAQDTTALEPAGQLTLSAVRVPDEDVLLAPGGEGSALEWLWQHATAAVAAAQLGVTDAMLRMTASYTAEREQFGKKIATFQAVAQRAANAFIDVECLRVNTQQAVWLLSEGRSAHDEVAIAKYWVGDTGHRVSYAAQHLHGGMGVDTDYPLHRYCRWAKHYELMLGSSAHHLERLGAEMAAS